MMPARLGEGVIAMLPRSPRLTITPAPGAARGLAKAVEGATLALAKFGAAVGQVLAASMARTPARKPGVALLPGRRTAKKFGGVPIVRIHFPPADSQSLSLSRFSRWRTPLFRAGLGSWLGDRVSRDAPGSPLRANRRQYLCRPIFQYRSAAEVVSENAAPVPTKLGLLRA
jgi:hypothetical protein